MAKDAPARSAVAQTSQTTIMDKDWCALTWGLWVPLERQAIIRTTPALPGVYRIRRKGGAGNRLVYIGQTGRTLRERLLSSLPASMAVTLNISAPLCGIDLLVRPGLRRVEVAASVRLAYQIAQTPRQHGAIVVALPAGAHGRGEFNDRRAEVLGGRPGFVHRPSIVAETFCSDCEGSARMAA